MTDRSNGRRIGAVQRSCEILQAMRTTDGVSVSELSDRVDLSAGAVHTHLATLREYGLIVKEGTTYRLGPQLVPFGEFVKHHSPLYQAARPELDALANETGECAHLLVENNGLSVFIYEAFGDNAVGTSYHVRSRTVPPHYLHNHAAGKALLAHYPSERVDEIIAEHGLEPATEETITDRETLRSAFRTIRERGYALNDEEEIREEYRDYGEKVTGEVCDAAADAGVDCVTAIRSGAPAEEIVNYAEGEGVDTIVMGSGYRGRLRGILSGTTDKVVRISSVPVVSLRASGEQ